MEAILAFGFPALVVFVAWTALRPADVLRRLPPRPSEAIDRSPLPHRTHLAWSGFQLALGLGLGWLLAEVQRVLLTRAAGDPAWPFSWRATDDWPYALIPGFLTGLLAGFPIFVRIVHWRHGERLADLVDRPARDVARLSLRAEVKFVPKIAAVATSALCLLNAAAFDTFLRVGNGRVRYSTFFSTQVRDLPISEVRELAVLSGRVAPDGRVTNKRFLELRLRDGAAVDTYYLIEERQIPDAIAALQREAAASIPISFGVDSR